MKIALNTSHLGLLTTRMEKLNKRLVKLGISTFSIVSSESFIDLNEYNSTPLVDDGRINMIRNKGPIIMIEITGPELVKHDKNISYVGTISDKKGARSIYSTDSSVHLFEMDCRCDHCHQKRMRNVHHVFRVENELTMVGSGCCHEYFGYDPIKIINAWTTISAKIDDEELMSYGRNNPSFDISSVIMFANHATKNWTGYTSQTVAQDRGIMSTKSAVSDLLWFNPQFKSPQEKEEYANIINNWDYSKNRELIQKVYDVYGSMTPTNDFEFNMISALTTSYGGQKFITYDIPAKLLGIAIYGIYKVFHVEAPKVEKKPSNFIGSIGDKIGISGKKKGTIKVKITSTKSIDTQFGWTTLVTMEDETGNVYKSFTSTDVPEVNSVCGMYGTVKNHEDYNGFKSTMLTRIKFVNL